MEGFDTHVGCANTAFEQAPEVLKAVGMDAPANVFDCMIHNLVRVVPGQTFVGEQSVSVESSSRFNVGANLRLESSFLAVGYYDSFDLAAALKDAHNSDLMLGAGASDAACLDA